jgi:hypothetical protein
VWAPTGEELVEHHAQRVHVGGHRHRRAGELLGRRVPGGEQARARVRAPGRVVVRVVEQLGDAEVEQLGRAVGVDEHVRRLEVAVHHEVAVGVRHRLAHALHEPQALGDAQAPRLAVAVDRLAAHVLHGEPRRAVVGDAGVEQAGDVRVLEAREHAPLAQEPLDAPGRGEPAAGDHLERHGEPHVGALGEVDGAHAAAADERPDRVRAEAPPGHRGRVGAEPLVGEQRVGEGADRRAPRGAVEQPVAVGAGVVLGEQPLGLGAQRGVVAAQRVEHRAARRRRGVERRVEHALELAPALGRGGDHGHAPARLRRRPRRRSRRRSRRRPRRASRAAATPAPRASRARPSAPTRRAPRRSPGS